MRKIFFLITILICCFHIGYTQSLPGIQPGSFKAPTDIKIDGRDLEWKNSFQAYNKNMQVFYTIANDQENLYLVLKSTDHDISRKIIMGVTIKIFPLTGSSKLSITYPGRSEQDVLHIAQVQSGNKTLGEFISEYDAKEIDVEGIAQINGNTVSIYNELGIKAAIRSGENNSCTYELALPLRYLPAKKFRYQVILNGASQHGLSVSPSESGRYIIITTSDKPVAYPNIGQYASMLYPTDLKGEYTLLTQN